MKKTKVESFNENILQNLRSNIKDIFDSEFTITNLPNLQASSVRYNKQIDHLQKRKTK